MAAVEAFHKCSLISRRPFNLPSSHGYSLHSIGAAVAVAGGDFVTDLTSPCCSEVFCFSALLMTYVSKQKPGLCFTSAVRRDQCS